MVNNFFSKYCHIIETTSSVFIFFSENPCTTVTNISSEINNNLNNVKIINSDVFSEPVNKSRLKASSTEKSNTQLNQTFLHNVD